MEIDARNFELSIVVTDTARHRQDRLQYTAPQLAIARSVMMHIPEFQKSDEMPIRSGTVQTDGQTETESHYMLTRQIVIVDITKQTYVSEPTSLRSTKIAR